MQILLNMKKYSIVILSGFILLSSCKKEKLDLFPYNQVETTQAFKTEADAKLAVDGMYFGLRSSGSYYQGGWTIVSDVTSDNLIINSSGPGRGSQKLYQNWQYTSASTYGFFGAAYTIARRSNAIIENIDKIPGASPAFTANAKGQALAIRGMVFFDLARVYAKTPLNASAADSMLPYVTTTDPTIFPARETIVGFYDKVIKDLNDALPLINASNGIGKLNKAAVNGLLSRVYLYKGEWANCITAATAALGNTPSVTSLANFPGIWKDASNDGVLFKVINTLVDNSNTLGTNYFQVVAGSIKSEYVVDYDFRQLFLANDVRTDAYIRSGLFNGSTFNNVVKWEGKPGFPAGVLDAKVLRSAEVLLNRAESYYKNNNEVAALADLVLLKTNRYVGYVAEVLSGQALLDEIYLQRRLELAFEGDRFWDLKRRNLPVNRGNSGDKADGTGIQYLFKTLPAGDYRFNFPLPQSEISVNRNLTQNIGYN